MFKLSAPSKINLFLKVTGKLPSGYHEIETIFVPLHDISDTICISKANKGITITSTSNQIPLDENNLCYKAAYLYAEESALTPYWNIDIKKNIPVAAGMGGGSSNAATVLLLLQEMYNKLSKETLREIALKLGADVPFFLNPIPSLAKGIGEKLHPIEMKNGLYAVIIAPLFPVSAAWAYKNFKKPENAVSSSLEKIIKEMESGSWENLSSSIYNDLAFALYEKFPLLNILKNELLNAGALNAEITGSGPTLFGLCKNKPDAEKLLDKINPEYKKIFYCAISKAG